MTARPATPTDAADIARIYNDGIEDRIATFETRPRSEADIQAWFDGVHPIVVVEDSGAVVAFAATSTTGRASVTPESPRPRSMSPDPAAAAAPVV